MKKKPSLNLALIYSAADGDDKTTIIVILFVYDSRKNSKKKMNKEGEG